MENKMTRFGKSFLRLCYRWFINTLIITIIAFIFESTLDFLHWNTWELFSKKMKSVDHAILTFAKQVSPAGLYITYTADHTKNRYGMYFNKLSAPFNLTRACTAMQKRVFPVDPNDPGNGPKMLGSGYADDSDASDKVPLYYLRNESWRPTRKMDPSKYNIEPGYLQNACSLDINNENVIKGNFERSGWEWLLALPDSIMDWMVKNWYYEDGSSNWPGRIFLLWSLLFASFASAASAEKEKPGLLKRISGFIGRFLLSMIFFGLVALLLAGIIWVILGIGYAVTGLAAALAALGGFFRTFVSEAREHASFQGKHEVAEVLKKKVFHGFMKKIK